MTTWKCPHCKSMEIAEEEIVIVLCPNCADCNMERVDEEEFLQTEKPEDFRGFDKSGRQVCMRCGKFYAKEKEIFCDKCMVIREKMNQSIRRISKINEAKKEKPKDKFQAGLS